MAIRASRRVAYRTRTCFWRSWAPAGVTGASATTIATSGSKRTMTEASEGYPGAVLEVDLGRDLEEPWRHDRHRLQPRPARDERSAVGEGCARIQRVVDV